MAEFGRAIIRLREMADVLQEAAIDEVRPQADMNDTWPSLSSHEQDKAVVRTWLSAAVFVYLPTVLHF